jgi:hypothetical protein
MILALLAVAVTTQAPHLRDSASVAQLLASLRTADVAVCELAGRALTNFGGWWGKTGDAGGCSGGVESRINPAFPLRNHDE